MKKMSLGVTTALLVCLLSGCGGLLLLASSFLAVGNLVGTIQDWGLFDRDTSKYNLYLDGYNTGVHPEANGTLNLTGLPVGQHVLSLIHESTGVGFHTNVSVAENQQLPLGSITLIQGSVISGKVEKAAGVGLAGVRVAAIAGGASLITQGQSKIQLPTGSGKTVIMGFTDAQGNYRLGPAAPGQWLVTSVAAGSYADAAIVNVATSQNANNVNLMLNTDPAAQRGTLTGGVTQEGAGALADALVATNFATPFEPQLPEARRTALASQVGLTLMDGAWFQWNSLATTTASAGAYTLHSAAGTQTVNAFKFGWRAKGTDVTLGDGQSIETDFALPRL